MASRKVSWVRTNMARKSRSHRSCIFDSGFYDPRMKLSRSSRTKSALLGLSVWAALGPVLADELATFKELQAKYQSFLKENGKPLFDRYQFKLMELEKSAVQQRNYGLAAKIKAERETAGRELGISISDATSQPLPESAVAKLEADGSVTMNAPAASLGGGVVLDTEKEALTGWTNDKSFARWKLPTGLKSGGYEVELTYSCAGGGGGIFVVKEDIYSLKREAKDSGSWASFRPEICGTLRVKSGSQNLQISASVVTGEGLFFLKSVRLLPCAAVAGS